MSVHRGHNSANKHSQWKGGFFITSKGYKKVLVSTGKYVYEHILIAEWSAGRKLNKNEIVHHLNHNPLDNRVENLRIMDRGEHSRLHQTGRRISEETRKKLLAMRMGTNQKEKHTQWRADVTKKRLTALIKKGLTQREIAAHVEMCADSVRQRMKYFDVYNLFKEIKNESK